MTDHRRSPFDPSTSPAFVGTLGNLGALQGAADGLSALRGTMDRLDSLGTLRSALEVPGLRSAADLGAELGALREHERLVARITGAGIGALSTKAFELQRAVDLATSPAVTVLEEIARSLQPAADALAESVGRFVSPLETFLQTHADTIASIAQVAERYAFDPERMGDRWACERARRAARAGDMLDLEWFTTDRLGLPASYVFAVAYALTCTPWDRGGVGSPLGYIARVARRWHAKSARALPAKGDAMSRAVLRDPMTFDASTNVGAFGRVESATMLGEILRRGELAPDVLAVIEAARDGYSRESTMASHLGWPQNRVEAAWKRWQRLRARLQ